MRYAIVTATVSTAIVGAQAASLAIDGTYVYWSQGSQGSGAIYRTTEVSPGAVTSVVSSGVFNYTFTTNGTSVFFSDGTLIWSVPANGAGVAAQIAPAHGAGSPGSLAVGAKLLAWTDAATIWAMVLP
jgi:hypothetical protein